MGCGTSSPELSCQQDEFYADEEYRGQYMEDNQQAQEQPAVYTQDQRDQALPAAVNDPNQYANLQGLTYKKMYSIREISEHNALMKFCELFPWKRGVHSTAIFKEDIKAEFLEMENEIYGSTEYNENRLNFSENWLLTPVAVFMERGLKFIKIKKCINNSKVADLRIYNDKEYSNDISVDARAVEIDLKNDTDITVYQTEYLEVLGRYFHRLNENQGIIPIHSKVPNGDPNLASFPLPDSVAEDPAVLRKWIVEWLLFDTEVSYDNPWNSAWEYVQDPSEPAVGDLLPTDDLYRKDFYWNFDDFNLEVIPQDIVKNDTTTPEQDAIWGKRDQRSDLYDPERMLKRRQELANYFITKRADGLPTYCDDYKGFAENLEKAWKEFQEFSYSWDILRIRKYHYSFQLISMNSIPVDDL